MQWNCNSTRSKIPLIKDYVIREKINTLALSEAKCSDEETRDILRFDGFDTNHKGRTNKGGGHGPHNR